MKQRYLFREKRNTIQFIIDDINCPLNYTYGQGAVNRNHLIAESVSLQISCDKYIKAKIKKSRRLKITRQGPRGGIFLFYITEYD